MKRLLCTALALACATANAQDFTCPAEAKGGRLTNAGMQIGARQEAHALHGDVDQAKDGTTIRYIFPDDVPRWLVCQYGGRRVGETAISAARVIGAYEVWIQLDPMLHACDLAIRAAKPKGRNDSAWTAAAVCKRKVPPPPDML